MPRRNRKEIWKRFLFTVLNTNVEKSTHPALLNDVILQEIFELLPLEDFKTCRLVCQKWKMVGEPFFKKRVRIHFDCMNLEGPHLQYYLCPEDLNEFFKAAQREFPFRAITFGGELPWSTINLASYFSTEGKFITDLVFCNVVLLVKGAKQTSYSLSELIRGIENLKRLRIINNDFTNESFTNFRVSTDELKNLEYIGIEKCTLDLTENIICPVELHLLQNTYTRQNVHVNNILIDEFVDFSVLKVMSVVNSIDRTYDAVNLTLDLLGSITLHRLKLENVQVLNFDISSWNVKFLDISMVTIPLRYDLKFEELAVSDVQCSLRNLPPKVHKLIIGSRTTFVDESSLEISLPNIKFLELHFEEAVAQIFPHLRTAFNHVKELRLKSYSNCDIDVSQIPESVQVLILHEDVYGFVGDNILTIDQLVVEKIMSFEFLLKVSQHLAPRNLKISKNYCGLEDKRELGFLSTFLNTTIPFVSLGQYYGKLLAYLKNHSSYKSIDDFNGQIVNENGSVIKFSFSDKKTSLASIRQSSLQNIQW